MVRENPMVKTYRSYIQCGHPTPKKQYVFSREIIEKAIEFYLSKDLRIGMLEPCGDNFSYRLDFVRASHTIDNVYIDDEDFLCVDISFMDTPYGSMAEDHQDSIQITPIIKGVVIPEGGDVKQMTIEHFNLSPMNINGVEKIKFEDKSI